MTRKTSRSTIQKRVPPVPYLQNVARSGLELQRKALEEAAKRKTMTEVARARYEGTSSQVRVPSPKGIVVANSATISRTVPQPSQKQQRRYNEIVKKGR